MAGSNNSHSRLRLSAAAGAFEGWPFSPSPPGDRMAPGYVSAGRWGPPDAGIERRRPYFSSHSFQRASSFSRFFTQNDQSVKNAAFTLSG